jgi:ArsR family transcriptional regulator
VATTFPTIPLVELPVRERGVCCVPARRLPAERVNELTGVLKALADPTRVEMVAILKEAGVPMCICDLDAAFDLSQPTLSHHMAKLKDAGLVEAVKQGIWVFYRLRDDLSPAARRLVDAIA